MTIDDLTPALRDLSDQRKVALQAKRLTTGTIKSLDAKLARLLLEAKDCGVLEEAIRAAGLSAHTAEEIIRAFRAHQRAGRAGAAAMAKAKPKAAPADVRPEDPAVPTLAEMIAVAVDRAVAKALYARNPT